VVFIGSRINKISPWILCNSASNVRFSLRARRGLNPVLAGRHADPIERLAAELNLPARVFDLGDAAAAAAALAGMAIVANCAGPFAATSAPMIDTCLISRTHYLDITGEIDVFVAAQRRHAEA
jgi:short subunit dehydrogenase-like uncharacterized protein